MRSIHVKCTNSIHEMYQTLTERPDDVKIFEGPSGSVPLGMRLPRARVRADVRPSLVPRLRSAATSLLACSTEFKTLVLKTLGR